MCGCNRDEKFPGYKALAALPYEPNTRPKLMMARADIYNASYYSGCVKAGEPGNAGTRDRFAAAAKAGVKAAIDAKEDVPEAVLKAFGFSAPKPPKPKRQPKFMPSQLAWLKEVHGLTITNPKTLRKRTARKALTK